MREVKSDEREVKEVEESKSKCLKIREEGSVRSHSEILEDLKGLFNPNLIT